MPLNKLDNFIKNTEGRILYVSPSDLDATDSITNSGNSLARPFKTLQRALIESARFSSFEKEQSIVTEFFPKKFLNLLNCEFDNIGLFKT